MTNEMILYPLLAMALLTFFVGFSLLRLRFKAVKQDSLNPRYFLLNKGGKAPEYLVKTEQHYLNLFELPILFYLLVITLYVTQQVDMVQLVLAWGFVFSRIAHTVIHLTINRLVWRMRAFVTGAVMLLLSWIYLGLNLISAS
ncbi:MAPEG family protein [Thiomicrorhabdus sp. ZW0627]|uniref:MAPEG family protein n=1 Tax=Thiomicrorhabdus sp. ZW0627 TaxID=3039774 RepID=UPI002436718D|nr:MAPEG family protein [Thiomicrorhabdus sp. ZW0627]MDG6772858.1 MAPEG family protein [Thiomicrorhabdus sp. ZW0627]